jgi:hypothetical protein
MCDVEVFGGKRVTEFFHGYVTSVLDKCPDEVY